MNNNELIKQMILEKDKAKLKYKQRLNSIMQHYGVEFDVEHFKDEKLKSIKFMNLQHKNNYDNLSVTYNGTTGKIDYIDYDFSDSRVIKNSNHKRLIPTLEKEFKLKMMVAEIDRANTEYIKEINEIEVKFQITKENVQDFDRILQIDKNEED